MPWPPQGIYAKKDINTVDDMKGLKWRSYNVGTARIGELVGAQSVTIQAAELPQALATGVVNSFMSSGATGYDSKVWESLTHFYDTQAWLPKNIIFVNKAAFDALDKPTAGRVLKAAAAAEERGWKLSEDKTKLVSRPAQGQGHEGPAAEPRSRQRLQEARRAAHRRLAEEGRRRRPGRRRRLQEDVSTLVGTTAGECLAVVPNPRLETHARATEDAALRQPCLPARPARATPARATPARARPPASQPSSLGPIVSSAHLAAGGMPALSEFEFGLIIASHAFHRWMVRAMAAAGIPDLSALDVLVLHNVNHRGKPSASRDVCLVLNIEDTHLVTYAMKKLERLKLVKSGRAGKEKVVTITPAGEEACPRYREIREALLVRGVKHRP